MMIESLIPAKNSEITWFYIRHTRCVSVREISS